MNKAERKHVKVLQGRIDYLNNRIQRKLASKGNPDWDIEERNAIVWALELAQASKQDSEMIDA